MTAKERLHKLVDELSEAEADDALRYVVSRHEHEDKPGDVIDEWGNLSAMTRASSRRMLKRLDEEEIAEHGETIAETFARAERENPR
jgi:hypothetical protein